MSVVGHDDNHLSRLMPIGLTIVRQGALLMAEHAVRFAVERLENPEREPREAVLNRKVVVRGTSGPPRASAWQDRRRGERGARSVKVVANRPSPRRAVCPAGVSSPTRRAP